MELGIRILENFARAIWNGIKKGMAQNIRIAIAVTAAIWMYLNEGCTELIAMIFEAMPEAQQYALAPYVTYLGHANLWFPLAEWFVLFSVYMAFLVTFIIVKIILKLIPTIG